MTDRVFSARPRERTSQAQVPCTSVLRSASAVMSGGARVARLVVRYEREAAAPAAPAARPAAAPAAAVPLDTFSVSKSADVPLAVLRKSPFVEELLERAVEADVAVVAGAGAAVGPADGPGGAASGEDGAGAARVEMGVMRESVVDSVLLAVEWMAAGWVDVERRQLLELVVVAHQLGLRELMVLCARRAAATLAADTIVAATAIAHQCRIPDLLSYCYAWLLQRPAHRSSLACRADSGEPALAAGGMAVALSAFDGAPSLLLQQFLLHARCRARRRTKCPPC
jgi:hypothetical protein